MRRIARIGRALCDRPESQRPADPSVEAFFREARLFFDYTREDYPSALASLEAFEEHTSAPDLRMRLLSLRTQIFLGMGEPDRANDVAEYILTEGRRAPRPWETTPAGIALGSLPGPATRWPFFLKKRIDDRLSAAAGKAVPEDDAVVNRIRAIPIAPVPGPLMPFEPRLDRFRALDEIPERLVPPRIPPDGRLRFQQPPFAPR